MENLYTEKVLNFFKKDELLEVASANKITVPDKSTNPQIIELILGKNCAMSEEHTAKFAQPKLADDPDAEKYPKEHFLNSHWYSHKRSVLESALEDGKKYSFAGVEWLLKNAK